MIEVHVRDDHVFDLIGIKPDHPQSVSDRTQQRALSFRRAGGVETGVKHKTPVLPDNRPDEIVKRHRPVVRIAADEVVRCRSVVMTVADREEIVSGAQIGILSWRAIPPLPVRLLLSYLWQRGRTKTR